MSKTGIKLNLEGVSGNAFAILGVCQQALRRGGKSDMKQDFMKEATAGDYTHLLATVSDWFDICFEDEDEEEDEEAYN